MEILKILKRTFIIMIFSVVLLTMNNNSFGVFESWNETLPDPELTFLGNLAGLNALGKNIVCLEHNMSLTASQWTTYRFYNRIQLEPDQAYIVKTYRGKTYTTDGKEVNAGSHDSDIVQNYLWYSWRTRYF